MNERLNYHNGDLDPFLALAKEFSRKELVERREEHDRYPFGPFWAGVMRRAHEVGFFSVTVPSEFGGLGMNAGILAPVLQELSRADASLAVAIFTHTAACGIIDAAMDNADPGSLYRLLLSRRDAPAAFQSFSHPDEIEMPVVRHESGKTLISGSLSFLVLTDMAEFAIVPALTRDSAGFSYYVVSLKNAGIHVSGNVFSLGLHACPAADVTLNDAEGILIGAEGKGMDYYRAMSHHMSLPAAAISLGIMEGSLDEALSYSTERLQGGRRILHWPEVRMILSGMAEEIETAKAALQRIASMMESSEKGWQRAAVASQLRIGEASCGVTTDGVQILGGYGYMKDYGQEKRMRDAHQACSLLGMEALRKLELIDENGAQSPF